MPHVMWVLKIEWRQRNETQVKFMIQWKMRFFSLRLFRLSRAFLWRESSPFTSHRRRHQCFQFPWCPHRHTWMNNLRFSMLQGFFTMSNELSYIFFLYFFLFHFNEMTNKRKRPVLRMGRGIERVLQILSHICNINLFFIISLLFRNFHVRPAITNANKEKISNFSFARNDFPHHKFHRDLLCHIVSIYFTQKIFLMFRVLRYQSEWVSTSHDTFHKNTRERKKGRKAKKSDLFLISRFKS